VFLAGSIASSSIGSMEITAGMSISSSCLINMLSNSELVICNAVVDQVVPNLSYHA